jgi:hypothetical protein
MLGTYVRRSLNPDVEVGERLGITSCGVVSTFTGLVDVVLHDRGAHHREGGGEEAESDTLERTTVRTSVEEEREAGRRRRT